VVEKVIQVEVLAEEDEHEEASGRIVRRGAFQRVANVDEGFFVLGEGDVHAQQAHVGRLDLLEGADYGLEAGACAGVDAWWAFCGWVEEEVGLLLLLLLWLCG
jgi:hypothetical protein